MDVTRVTAEEAAAYLDRLGVEPGPPTYERLVAIHRAQVERVPYETTWIHLGETWTVDPGAALRRIVAQRRGGYCFHLNGALGVLLRSLGYDVTTHAARVQVAPDEPHGPVGNHATLVVRGLHGDGTEWLVDVGLGDGLYEPIPLVPGRYHQPPYTFTVERDDAGHCHVLHDERGSFTGFAFGPPPPDVLAVFATRHADLSASPDSGFVRAVTAQRRDATGADILRALTLSRIETATADKQVLDDRDDWFTALADLFDLTLTDTSPAARDRLWAHANAAHEAHAAATAAVAD